MNRYDLVRRVRSITRDLSNSIFREIDIVDYLNEGIERLQQLIPEYRGMTLLEANTDVPKLLPSHYHHLLSVYSASRCFMQDEQYYQASTLMNEFESKMNEMVVQIDSGELVITNPDGTPVTTDDTINNTDYVVDTYFDKLNRSSDTDVI